MFELLGDFSMVQGTEERITSILVFQNVGKHCDVEQGTLSRVVITIKNNLEKENKILSIVN